MDSFTAQLIYDFIKMNGIGISELKEFAQSQSFNDVICQQEIPDSVSNGRRYLRRGDKIVIAGEKYIIASMCVPYTNWDPNNISIVNLETGNIWADSVKVNDFHKITKHEFTIMSGIMAEDEVEYIWNKYSSKE